MGTRGAFGVRVGGVDKITYNHFDSYPEGLGDDILRDTKKLLRDPGLDGFRELATTLRMVSESGLPPTPEEQEKFSRFLDLGVGNQDRASWYCLLRELQGELADSLNAGVMIEGAAFMTDSVMNEWSYIVNLDDEKIEVYRGFQRAAHKLGRYAALPVDARCNGFHPVALFAEVPFSDLGKHRTLAKFLPKEPEE